MRSVGLCRAGITGYERLQVAAVVLFRDFANFDTSDCRGVKGLSDGDA